MTQYEPKDQDYEQVIYTCITTGVGGTIAAKPTGEPRLIVTRHKNIVTACLDTVDDFTMTDNACTSMAITLTSPSGATLAVLPAHLRPTTNKEGAISLVRIRENAVYLNVPGYLSILDTGAISVHNDLVGTGAWGTAALTNNGFDGNGVVYSVGV